MNFYLSAVDDLLKHPADHPSIGIILCKSKAQVTAEYALRDLNKPIGVAEWQAQITKSLPEQLQTELPTIEELEAELEAFSAESYGCTVPEFLLGILQIMAKPEVLHNPILGLFADEPEAMEQILSEIARDRGWTRTQPVHG